MACNSCSSSSTGGAPKGCKNNGSCGTDSCNKLTVFDWLSNMNMPVGEKPFDCVEVRFKNGRKEFFRNTDNLSLVMGDLVATEASPGHDIGIVTLTGALVKVQMKKKGVNPEGKDIVRIYRKASQKDIDIWTEAKGREETIKVRARQIALQLNLEMKISDVEFQGDGSKATFYYTANERVDFRQLIKEFAREFSTRVEMKQVGFRQEAARLGGIGSCGRELCCSTWLTDFRSVNTAAARYQQLSLNPLKLAGQCGKLKCCLNYELDTYLDALKEFPAFDTRLKTEKGDAFCQKQDIFKGLMWFAYADNPNHWHTIGIEQVKEIMAENKETRLVTALEDYAMEVSASDVAVDFTNAMGQESITRFDKPKQRRKRPSGKSRNSGGEKGTDVQARPRRDRDDRRRNKPGKPDAKPENRNENRGENRSGNKPERRPENKGPRPERSGDDRNKGQQRKGNNNRRNNNRRPNDNRNDQAN